MARQSISLTKPNNEWLKTQVESQEYASKSELINDLVRQDLIRIHHYGVEKFGTTQADKYFNSFFDYFEIIAQQPFAFESTDHIKEGYRRCPCGVDSIYYRIANNNIEIMAIIGTQDVNNIL